MTFPTDPHRQRLRHLRHALSRNSNLALRWVLDRSLHTAPGWSTLQPDTAAKYARKAAHAAHALERALAGENESMTDHDQPRVLKYGVGYDLVVLQEATRLTLGIRCHTCQRISCHPKDIIERYCGACHVFHEDHLLAHEG